MTERHCPKRLFFSHPLATYNTPIETKCLSLLRYRYPDYRIINPKYIVITEPINTAEDFEGVIRDYILPIVKSCDLIAYYKDDSYSPGVDIEIAEAQRLNIPIIKLEF